MAPSAGGTTSGAGGITSRPPETVEVGNVSPLARRSTAGSLAAKLPPMTGSGTGSKRWLVVAMAVASLLSLAAPAYPVGCVAAIAAGPTGSLAAGGRRPQLTAA